MFSLLSIEGNIASGKSTLLSLIKQHCQQRQQQIRFCFIPEPLEELQENGWIRKLYEDKKKYAFPFQLIMLLKRWTRLLQEFLNVHRNPVKTVIITERSMYSDSRIFTAVLHSMGYIDDCDMHLIQEAYDSYMRTLRILAFKEIGFIYIDTNKEECYRRYKERERSDELLDITYLAALENVHKSMLDARNLSHFIVHQNYGIQEVANIVSWILQL